MGKAHQTAAEKADDEGAKVLQTVMENVKRTRQDLSAVQKLQKQSSTSRVAQSAVHDMVGNVVRQLPAMLPLEPRAKRSRV